MPEQAVVEEKGKRYATCHKPLVIDFMIVNSLNRVYVRVSDVSARGIGLRRAVRMCVVREDYREKKTKAADR